MKIKTSELQDLPTNDASAKGNQEAPYGIKPSMDPGVMLDCAVEVAGWSDSAAVDVLLDYIRNQERHHAFADYLVDRVSNEGDTPEELL